MNNYSSLPKKFKFYFDYKAKELLCFYGIPVCKRAVRHLIHPKQFTIKEKNDSNR